MKLSVIIPCFNASDTLAVQLEALAEQKWSEPWEVLLSDNGSTDDSVAIARQYENRLPNFQIIDASEIRGPSYARNMGAKAAVGESLAFCDADDKVAPGWVAAMGNALLKYDFVTCRFEAKKLSDPFALQARMCPQEHGLQTYDYPPFLPHAASAGLGVKRAIHETVGGFNESMPMLEDTDYCWRIQLRGVKLHFVPDALVHYRFRSSKDKMYRQARLWGEYNVFLYKKYRLHGMPPLSKKRGIRKGMSLLRRFPAALRNGGEQLNRWHWDFAWFKGRVLGSFKYRIFGL